MKRKNLPLSLLLITMILGVVTLGFDIYQSGDREALSHDGNVALVSSPDAASTYLQMMRANQVTGVIAPEDYQRVQNQLTAFGHDRAEGDLKWTQLGPDNFGGRTRAILFDNQTADATVLYAGAVSGGIWKSTNIGVTWTKVNEASYNLNVSCMAQASDGTIYAGTGELFDNQMYSGLEEMGYTTGFMGQGIYKSTDGENFSLLASTQPTFNNIDSDWAFINELAVDPNGGGLYASTNAGLKFSADKGATWTTATDTAGTELSANSYDVAVSSEGAVITVVDNAVYLSTSGAADQFVLKSTGDSVSLPVANDVRRIEFAWAPSDPNFVYASIVDKFGSMYGVYLSEDKGATWRVVLPGSQAVPIFAGYGNYNNSIVVFPDNSGKILLGGYFLWEGTMVQETGFYAWEQISLGGLGGFSVYSLNHSQHKVVFRPGSPNTFFVANDAGVYIGNVEQGEYRYESSNRNYFTTQFYNVAPSGIENYVLGGAQNTGSVLITGTNNTVQMGEQVLNGNGGACALSVINKEVMVVSAAGGNLFRSEDAGFTYSNQFVGGLDISSDYFNTPLALWESFDNPNSRDSLYYHSRDTIEGGTRIQVLSECSGQPFYYTTPADVTLYPGDSIQVCDVVSSRLFIASDNIVGMTKDLHRFAKNPEWFVIANSDVNFIGDPQCLGYSSDANHLFVGMRDGRLYRISNLALAYNYERADVHSQSCIVSTQEIPLYVPGTTTPITQVVTSVAVDPTNPNNVMVTLGNYGNAQYVLFSENALDQYPTFTSRQGNLPQMPVYSSILEMTTPDMAIVGTEHGIFINNDIHSSNANWVRQDSLMGSVPVFQLQQQLVNKNADTVNLVNGNEITTIIYPGTNNLGIIYGATFGRGLFRCNTFRKPVGVEENEWDVTASANTLKVYPNPVSTYANIELEATNNSDVLVTVIDLSGRTVMQQKESLHAGNNVLHFNMESLRPGVYVISAVAGAERYTQKFIVK